MKELFTRKIYYKKFDHRLAVRCRIRNHDAKAPTAEVVGWLLDRKFGKKSWRGIASSSYGYQRGRWVPNQNLYTVFFKDETIFDFLKEILGESYLEEYEKPMDAQHTEMLEKEKVITRKILFYNKYRIAIRVHPKRKPGSYGRITTHIDDMVQWCEEQFGPQVGNDDKYRIQRWNNATFYFASPKDAMLFKLVHQDITATERVVLVSELEEARAAEQAA